MREGMRWVTLRQGVGWGSVEGQGPGRQTGKDQLSIYSCLRGWQLIRAKPDDEEPEGVTSGGDMSGECVWKLCGLTA